MRWRRRLIVQMSYMEVQSCLVIEATCVFTTGGHLIGLQIDLRLPWLKKQLKHKDPIRELKYFLENIFPEKRFLTTLRSQLQ